MIEFFDAVLRFPFLQYALAAGVMASISSGIIGTYVVTRRISYIGGGIAHSVLAGMGAVYFFSVVFGWDNFPPLLGAIPAAILSALIIGWVTLRKKGREDTIIGAVWAVSMAIGIIFIFKTPGYNQDLMSYLFGNILLITPNDLILIGILDIIVVGIGLLFYRQFTLVCFDEEFARVRGINAELYYLLLLALVALTVVVLVSIVGIVMVIALLTLPVSLAGNFSNRLSGIMGYAIGFTILFTITGLAISYSYDLPAGAVIIIIAGAANLFHYFLGLISNRK
ncbi:MAG: metal ABC transporter permease [Candidatus Zixiibacteriota bacterium]